MLKTQQHDRSDHEPDRCACAVAEAHGQGMLPPMTVSGAAAATTMNTMPMGPRCPVRRRPSVLVGVVTRSPGVEGIGEQCRAQQIVVDGVGGEALVTRHRRGGDHGVDDRLLGGFDRQVEQASHQLWCDHSQRHLGPRGFVMLVPRVGRNAAVAGGERQHQVTAVLFAGTRRAGPPRAPHAAPAACTDGGAAVRRWRRRR